MALASETSAVDIQRVIGRKRDGFSTPRANLATTASYVASSHIDCSQGNKITLYFTLTWVDSTSHTYYVEWSHDASAWFRSINVATATSVNTLTMNENLVTIGASTNWADNFERIAPYMRVQIKKTGGVGADAMKIEAHVTTL